MSSLHDYLNSVMFVLVAHFKSRQQKSFLFIWSHIFQREKSFEFTALANKNQTTKCEAVSSFSKNF